jgi:hypothetical protein
MNGQTPNNGLQGAAPQSGARLTPNVGQTTRACLDDRDLCGAKQILRMI